MHELAGKISKKLGNRKAVRGDAQVLPFRENSMDIVVSDHFLFSNYPKIDRGELKGSLRILEEVRRVLKPGGITIIYLITIREEENFFRNLPGFRLVEFGEKEALWLSKSGGNINYAVLKKE